RDYIAKQAAPASLIALEDPAGASAALYAPPGAQPSFEDRSQVMLAGTAIVDPSGRLRLLVMADSTRFDPTLAAIRGQLAGWMGEAPAAGATAAAGPAADEPTLKPEQAVALSVDPGAPLL